MEKTYYTIYKVTNKLNGKFYIGSHKTKKLDDNYMGSGKYLLFSIRKYGLENFTKEILFVFDNPKEMYEKEAEIVNSEFLVKENTYNLKVGGYGGWDYINESNLNNANKTAEALKKSGYIHKKRLETDEEYRSQHIKRCSERFKKLHKEGKIKHNHFLGKSHTQESKLKIGMKNSQYRGIKNSQFGTCWIYHELFGNKKCKYDNFPLYVEQGWYKGRKKF